MSSSSQYSESQFKPSIILGIESSCDETAAAILIDGELKSNVVATQAIHTTYGGVVPELASRAHQEAIAPVVLEALSQAGVEQHKLSAIAVTAGPGLLGSLLVGASFAKGYASALGIPLIAVNHMQAHVLAQYLSYPAPSFPFLCLTVSGGHTQLVWVKSALEMEILGQTEDDAVGEAFDKGAKLLGLPYPGGPYIDKLAATGNAHAFQFPIVRRPGLNFSFSGVKTALLYFLQKHDAAWIQEHLADIAASYQHTLIQTLLIKVREAVTQTGATELALAGGVAANKGLQIAMKELALELNCHLYIPPLAYCTDNAAMIAMAGHFLHEAGINHGLGLQVNPNMKI